MSRYSKNAHSNLRSKRKKSTEESTGDIEVFSTKVKQKRKSSSEKRSPEIQPESSTNPVENIVDKKSPEIQPEIVNPDIEAEKRSIEKCVDKKFPNDEASKMVKSSEEGIKKQKLALSII